MSYLLYVGVKDTMETTAKEMLFLSVLSRIIQATKLHHLSLWLPPCSWASLAIFQFWVKWFIYVYNFDTVNLHKRTKLIHWIIILSNNIKGLLRSCFFKTCCQRKENASVIPLMIAIKTTISVRGKEKKRESFLLCLSSKPCSVVLCHKHMNIKTNYIQYLPPSQEN